MNFRRSRHVGAAGRTMAKDEPSPEEEPPLEDGEKRPS